MTTRARADDPAFSERWDAAQAAHRIGPLEAAPPAAQALLAWLRTQAGVNLLAELVDAGRVERASAWTAWRREAGVAGWISEDGQVQALSGIVYSPWYAPGDSTCVKVGKATRGIPWALHTHSWGNSMSGTLAGLTDDFAYATTTGGRAGLLVCLPLREADGTESIESGRVQLIAPTDQGIRCYAGRWIRSGEAVTLVLKPTRLARR